MLLLRWSRRDPSRDVRALRARIVLGAAAGEQDLEIGRQLGVGRLTAARWRRRFLAARLQGIERSTARTPRAGGIAELRIQEIVRASALGTHFGRRRVSTRTLAQRFGVSHTTVRRLWTAFGVRPAGFEASPRRPDPVLPLEPRDVAGVYLHPPDFAVALILGPGTRGSSILGLDAPDGAARGAPSGWNGGGGSLPSNAWSSFDPPRASGPRLRELLRFLGGLERANGDRPPRQHRRDATRPPSRTGASSVEGAPS